MASTSHQSQLEGKVVLVTGAASGMGAACAELALERGALVIGVDRDEAALAALAGRIDIPYELCDLAEVDSLPQLVDRCADRHGRLDGLVNAAGVFQTGKLLEITPAQFDRIFAINVRGLFFIQQAVAAHMATQRGGSIVNFSSTAARIPRPISSHYAASKAAVVSITRSAAAALGVHGVRVNAVCPGIIQTPMIEAVQRERAELFDTTPDAIAQAWRDDHPMGRLGLPHEVADVVAFLLSDASSYVNGESIGIHGGSDDVG
jgi:NAD(P)-dependent dehydrogenase (short-subunit alcohol dehydrogenase family)